MQKLLYMPYRHTLQITSQLSSPFRGTVYDKKAMEAEMMVMDDIDTIILYAFTAITPNDCKNRITNIGIY